MLSRARSLGGVLVLRPFTADKITCRLSQDARAERQRLNIRSLTTQMELGSPRAQSVARAKLRDLGYEMLRDVEQSTLPKLADGQQTVKSTVDALQDSALPPNVCAVQATKVPRRTTKRDLRIGCKTMTRVGALQGVDVLGLFLLLCLAIVGY